MNGGTPAGPQTSMTSTVKPMTAAWVTKRAREKEAIRRPLHVDGTNWDSRLAATTSTTTGSSGTRPGANRRLNTSRALPNEVARKNTHPRQTKLKVRATDATWRTAWPGWRADHRSHDQRRPSRARRTPAGNGAGCPGATRSEGLETPSRPGSGGRGGGWRRGGPGGLAWACRRGGRGSGGGPGGGPVGGGRRQVDAGHLLPRRAG